MAKNTKSTKSVVSNVVAAPVAAAPAVKPAVSTAFAPSSVGLTDAVRFLNVGIHADLIETREEYDATVIVLAARYGVKPGEIDAAYTATEQAMPKGRPSSYRLSPALEDARISLMRIEFEASDAEKAAASIKRENAALLAVEKQAAQAVKPAKPAASYAQASAPAPATKVADSAKPAAPAASTKSTKNASVKLAGSITAAIELAKDAPSLKNAADAIRGAKASVDGATYDSLVKRWKERREELNNARDGF